MARLLLKFDSSVLREVPVGSRPITIGRAPDNDIRIDNLTVSDHHARIYSEGGRLRVEDLNSLNGISLNRYPIKKNEALNSGDEIGVGKHMIVVDLEHDALVWGGQNEPKKAAPKLEETVVLGKRRPFDSSSKGENNGAEASRAKIGSLVIIKGKTNRRDYLLTAKLIVIGKSSMATVQLRGWFAPGAAAQISQRPDGYYISPISNRPVTVNDKRVTDPVHLGEGDLIKVAGVIMKFMFQE